MKTITKSHLKFLNLAILVIFLTLKGAAVDLLEKYPTQLLAGDDKPENARVWQFGPNDIFRISEFLLAVGQNLRLETGIADLGIGHGADGAVWAVLIPREPGTLESHAVKDSEQILRVWLRFHPAMIDQLFANATVFADGNTNLASQIRNIANSKMSSSWQANGRALIPETNQMTVFVDTKSGSKRFFIVDTKKQTAEYVDAFNPKPASVPYSWATVPPVVVKTVPESGASNVSPETSEVRVTFSKEMTDQSWSWSTAWENSDSETIGAPEYDASHRTCMLKVKLKPGKTYGWWLNSQNFHNFTDTNGHPAIPYLLVFQTADK